MILVLLALLEPWGWEGQPSRKISGIPVVQTFIHEVEIEAVKQIIIFFCPFNIELSCQIFLKLIFQCDLWKADFGSTNANESQFWPQIVRAALDPSTYIIVKTKQNYLPSYRTISVSTSWPYLALHAFSSSFFQK